MSSPSAFARLPKVDRVLAEPALHELPWQASIKTRRVRVHLQRLREALRSRPDLEVPGAAAVAQTVCRELEGWASPRPGRVINATGVVLHTNLGRAPLADAAVAAMADAAGYCDLEVSLETGERGSRFEHLRGLATAVVGCEDVHVVNNNAAALLLACTALAGADGVALSRGQMVEIGDGFRVATMAGAAGCRVVAVGSTNRTHLSDYESALRGEGPDVDGRPVAALLWVHQSNFEQQGYVASVPLERLARLASDHAVPLIADLGSGALGAGLPGDEPTLSQYVASGVDLVLASGDKLLGGPQAGLLAGRGDLVERCRRHPMARALRPDKTTVAAMHATLVAHARSGVPPLPLHRMVGVSLEDLRLRAAQVCEALGWPNSCVVDSRATIGGGSLAGTDLPSVAVCPPVERPGRAAERLRTGTPPVFARVEQDRLLVDLRCVAPEDDVTLIEACRERLG